MSACTSQTNIDSQNQPIATVPAEKTNNSSEKNAATAANTLKKITQSLFEQTNPENLVEENALHQLAKWFVDTLQVDESAFDSTQAKSFTNFKIVREQSDLTNSMVYIDSEYTRSRFSFTIDATGVHPEEDPLQTKFSLVNDCQNVNATYFEYCEISPELLSLAFQKHPKPDLSLPEFEYIWNDFSLRLPGWWKEHLKFVEVHHILEIHIDYDLSTEQHLEEFLSIMPVRTIELDAWLTDFENHSLPSSKKAQVLYRDDTISLIAYQMHPSIYPILVRPANVDSIFPYAKGMQIQHDLTDTLSKMLKRIGLVQPVIRLENEPGYAQLNQIVSVTNKNIVAIDRDNESTLTINDEAYAELASEINTKNTLYLTLRDVVTKQRFEEFFKHQIQLGNLYEDSNGKLFARDIFAPLGDQYRDLKIVSTEPETQTIWVQPYFNPTDVSAPFTKELIQIKLDRDKLWKIASRIWW